jgi:hypothetical protein
LLFGAQSVAIPVGVEMSAHDVGYLEPRPSGCHAPAGAGMGLHGLQACRSSGSKTIVSAFLHRSSTARGVAAPTMWTTRPAAASSQADRLSSMPRERHDRSRSRVVHLIPGKQRRDPSALANVDDNLHEADRDRPST